MPLNKKRLIVIGSIVFILAIAIIFFFWIQSKSARGLNLQFDFPEQVLLGVPFDVSVNISNDSTSVLKDARLSLTLPEGLIFVGQSPEQNINYKEIGNLGSGSLTQETFKLMALTGENSLKRIEAGVSYLPISLGARFEKTQSFDLVVGGIGLPIDIVTPTKVFNGEDFETVVSFINASESDYSNLKLIIDYPPSFNFVKSTVELENNNREWQLGDLRKGSKNEFKIIGNIIGPENAFFDFKISIEAEFLNQRYLISSNSATLSITSSPLSLQINLNDNPDYIAQAGDILHYTLTYINNTDIGLKDVVIRARLAGSMFDFATLNTDASYRSFDNTLIWNASNIPTLGLVSPGDSGSVDFQIRAKSVYPIKRLNDKNFTLKVTAEIESPTVPYFVAAKKTISSLKFETKVAGQAKIDSRAYFRDAVSGIINEGPFPPRVNQRTNFTIHWLITNFATDISNVEVKAFLGPNVKMTGATKTAGGALSYNEQTQEVVWRIDKIIATKGVISEPLKAIFQVEAVPSLPGNYWPLIQSTYLRATDEFTGETLTAADSGIDTALPDDRSVTAAQGIVIQ